MLYPYRDHPESTPPSPTSHTSVPILAISIVGILVTTIFLLSYYVFVIKCCLNRHRPDVIRRISRSRSRWRNTTGHALSYPDLSSAVSRGLDRSTIQAIPSLKFKRGEQRDPFQECAVCLNEFQDEESVRMLPSCLHLFHIDCIDTWLQTHANCPLCRAAIPSMNPIPAAEPHVAIDVRDEGNVQTSESDGASNTNHTAAAAAASCSCDGKERKLPDKVLSLGDECIDLRGKDEDFAVQPIRRSFSMGSSSDRQLLHMAVQERLNHGEDDNGEGTSAAPSNSWRTRTPFFLLGGRCRNLRNSVIPIQNEQ